MLYFIGHGVLDDGSHEFVVYLIQAIGEKALVLARLLNLKLPTMVDAKSEHFGP